MTQAYSKPVKVHPDGTGALKKTDPRPSVAAGRVRLLLAEGQRARAVAQEMQQLRLFRRLKGFRRIFSRFEKLDTLFLGFILFALIFDALR